MKRNNLNHIDYNYLQGSNDPWFCIPCYNEIFLFGTLANKNFSVMVVNSSPTNVKNSDANINSTSLALKPSPKVVYNGFVWDNLDQTQ